jgi:plastocyanin
MVTAVVGLSAVIAILSSACSSSSRPAGPSGSSGATTLQQGAGGLVFAPTTLTVTKGESIIVKNVGTAAHTFTVTGTAIDAVNDPGKSQSVTIDLTPGTYPFVCRFHASLGMKGTLTVTG